MNAKEATFEVLDEKYLCMTFTGADLEEDTKVYCRDSHYTDTYLRYMREYRQKRGVKITCINKRKSLYRMER